MIDLHIHSTYSDGTKSPKELLDLYYETGYRTISITDHETLDGYFKAVDINPYKDLRIIPGVELETMYFNKKIHVLAYGFEAGAEQILDFMNKIKICRQTEAIKLFRKMRLFDQDIYQTVKYENDISIRNIINKMIEKGYGDTKDEIMDKYFGENGILYIKEFIPSVEEIVCIVKAAGGFVSLAHPFRITQDRDKVKEIVKELTNRGIEGIECYHPTHSDGDIEFCLKEASRHELKITGGHDYHRGVVVPSDFEYISNGFSL